MFTSVACILLLIPGQGKVAYARPELLAEPQAFVPDDARKGVVFIDARRKAEYLTGHIPDAVWVDLAVWTKAINNDDKEAWVKHTGALGITTESRIIVYDDGGITSAARVWWILRYWGCKNVRLLNGGWVGWKAVKGPISKETPEVTTTKPELKPQTTRLATKADLLKEIKDKTSGQILDARSEEEHTGEKGGADRSGAIPGAKHLDWSDLVEKKTMRFKSAEEMKKLFDKAGIDLKKPATTYCQSGGRSSVMAFALELMGGQEARNYYKSWAEWGNDKETPIVTPKK